MNIDQLSERLIRIESRLAQLMLHMGLDPQLRKYDVPRVDPGTPELKEGWPQVWRKRPKD